MSPFVIAVCGDKKFKDRKLLERALNEVHRRQAITRLITGNLAGAEEMAYWWAAQNPHTNHRNEFHATGEPS